MALSFAHLPFSLRVCVLCFVRWFYLLTIPFTTSREREIDREGERERDIELVELSLLKAFLGSDGGGASRRCGARGQGGSRWRGKPFLLLAHFGLLLIPSLCDSTVGLGVRRCFSGKISFWSVVCDGSQSAHVCAIHEVYWFTYS